MRSQIGLLILLVFSLFSFAQEANVQDKITLNSGEVFVGKIVMQNSEIIMLVNSAGERYQFQKVDIKSVSSEIRQGSATSDFEKQLHSNASNFGGIVELSAGISGAKNAFQPSPNSQLSLIFGSKNMLKQNLFLGMGIGYNRSFTSPRPVGFLPLFLRIQSAYSKKRTSPYWAMDMGYSVALEAANKGGVMAKISLGLARRISYRSVLMGSIYAGTQFFTGNLTETNQFGSFGYRGQTSMNNVGLSIGLSF